MFDGVVDQSVELRSIAHDCAHRASEGFNVSIFAYGQTSAGKTFTINAVVCDVVERLFSTSSIVCLSMMEVYNDRLVDLFALNSTLCLREDRAGVVVSGLSEHRASSVKELHAFLEAGTKSRSTAATLLNENSSRSHLIITFGFLDGPAKINCIDLAGSERLRKAHGDKMNSSRLREGISINSGLLALGNVINALRLKKSHVPFRDSKLTRLLQDSLSGNSRTVMIACISPSDRAFEETLNTLKYATRVRGITTSPVQFLAADVASHSDMRQEIERLQSLLSAATQSFESNSSWEVRVARLETELKAERNLTAQLEGDLFKAECAALDHLALSKELQRRLASLGESLPTDSGALEALMKERDKLIAEKVNVSLEVKKLADITGEGQLKVLEDHIAAKERLIGELAERDSQHQSTVFSLRKKVEVLTAEREKLARELDSAQQLLDRSHLEREEKQQQRRQLQHSHDARMRAAEVALAHCQQVLISHQNPNKQIDSLERARTELEQLKVEHAELKSLSHARQSTMNQMRVSHSAEVGDLTKKLAELHQLNEGLSTKLARKEEEIAKLQSVPTDDAGHRRREEVRRLDEIESDLSLAWQERQRVASALDQLRRGTDIKRRRKALDGWAYRLSSLQTQLEKATDNEQRRFLESEAKIALSKMQELERSLPEIDAMLRELEEEHRLLDDRVDSLNAAKDFHLCRLKAVSGSGLFRESTRPDDYEQLSELVKAQQERIVELSSQLAEQRQLVSSLLSPKKR